MKKVILITVSSLLALAIIGFFIQDKIWTKKMETAFSGLDVKFASHTDVDMPAATATSKGQETATNTDTNTNSNTSSNNEVPSNKVNKKKPSRSFDLSINEVTNYPYNEGKVFRWIYRNGQVYILDDTEQSFLALNPSNGSIQSRFGNRGGAPWENEGVSSFEIQDNNLYTLDQNKMSIRKSSINNPREVDYFYKSKTSFWDGCYLDGNKYLVLTDIESGEKGDFKFDVFNINTKQVEQSHHFRNIAGVSGNAKHLNVAYEGYFLRNERSEVFYICSKAGLFFKFDSAGKLLYKSNTLDNRPAPKVTTKTFGNAKVYIKEPDYSTNYSATVDNQYLYILSLVRFVKAQNLAIDLYDINTGAYRRSVELPNHEGQLPTEILKLNGNNLLVLYEDMQIVNYEIQ